MSKQDLSGNTPKITVYVVSHNYGRFLGDAIESVLRQTVDNWELLIIDDNSTDDTPKVMNLYKGDPRIRLFATEGVGLPAVCNLAIRESQGEYIIRLDGDDIFEENILLVLSNYLERYPECVMVFPDYYLIDEYGEIFAQERREKVYVNNHVLDSPANGACCLIRKRAIEELGGYREDLGAQDGYDLWNKLIGRYKFANVNIPLFYYRRHKTNLTNNIHHILVAKRQIKLDSVVDKLNDYTPIIAVIPCRRNYDFCPDFWKREIQGNSLLQKCIERCLSSLLFDHVVVTSDNPEVQDIMALFQDKRLRFFQRTPQDTIRSRSIVSTLEKIAIHLAPEWDGLFVLSYFHAPFVMKETLEEAIHTLILNEADSAIGVEEIRQPLFKRTAYGLQVINASKQVITDFDVVYRESNTSLATKICNIKTGSLTGSCIVNFTVSPDECFMINSEQTLRIAEIIAEDRNTSIRENPITFQV